MQTVWITRAALLGLLTGPFSNDLVAQGKWHDPPYPTPRTCLAGSGTYDPSRNAIVMGGGRNETYGTRRELWAFDGSTWSPMAGSLPEGHELTSITYDARRGRLVGIVYGVPGRFSQPSIGEFDGTTWSFPGTFPGFASEARVIYDSARGQVLAFGRYLGTALSTLWSWDGTAVRELATTPRASSWFAFDDARGVLVACFSEPSGDSVREWGGSAWTAIPTTLPSLQYWNGDQMVFDPSVNRVVLHGRDSATLAQVRWEWSGSAWLPATNAGLPDRVKMMLVGDPVRGRLVLFGGLSDRFHGDTWEFDGTAWSQRIADPASPPMIHVAMSELPAAGGLLVFGGPVLEGVGATPFETWLLQGEAWTQVPVLVGPSGRVDARMTTDTARQRVLLFGGRDATGPLADLWAFSAAGWQQLPSGPSARSAPGLCYDNHRDRVVVYGGTDTGLTDTWEFDGLQWNLRVGGFPPHAGPVYMAYDARRRRSVLATEGLGQVQTWLWDGSNWASTSPAHRPAQLGQLAFDPHRARTLMIVGDTTWEWDGADWSLTVSDLRSARPVGACAAYDGNRRRVVLFGGEHYPQSYPPLAIGHAVSFGSEPAASFEPSGSGCAGVSGEPDLVADGPPWLGDQMTVSASSLTSGSFVLLLTGFSDSMFQGVPLPYSLAAQGFPGCALHAGPELVSAFVPSTDRVDVPLSIPAAPYLVGQLFRQQVLAFEPGGTLAASAGREGHFGMR